MLLVTILLVIPDRVNDRSGLPQSQKPQGQAMKPQIAAFLGIPNRSVQLDGRTRVQLESV